MTGGGTPYICGATILLIVKKIHKTNDTIQ
jgi:hypothetical protein